MVSVQAWPRFRLSHASEQMVLKEGVRRLKDRVTPEDVLPELPRRPDGSSRLLRQSFFQRLLGRETELQRSLPGDVTAAQPDLRHLQFQHLLALRVRTLDFATESRSHEAHSNFLNTLDKHLFAQVASQHLHGEVPAVPEAALHRLGFHLALVLGALRQLEPQDGAPEPVPASWLLPLDEGTWGGCKLALFDTSSMRVNVLRGTQEDELSAAAAGQAVAVFSDRSSGAGKDRVLHWEVRAVAGDSGELFSEALRAQQGSPDRSKEKLGTELAAAIWRRAAGKAATTAAVVSAFGGGSPVRDVPNEEDADVKVVAAASAEHLAAVPTPAKSLGAVPLGGLEVADATTAPSLACAPSATPSTVVALASDAGLGGEPTSPPPTTPHRGGDSPPMPPLPSPLPLRAAAAAAALSAVSPAGGAAAFRRGSLPAALPAALSSGAAGPFGPGSRRCSLPLPSAAWLPAAPLMPCTTPSSALTGAPPPSAGGAPRSCVTPPPPPPRLEDFAGAALCLQAPEVPSAAVVAAACVTGSIGGPLREVAAQAA